MSTGPRYLGNPPDVTEDQTRSILSVLEEGGEVKEREIFVLGVVTPVEVK